ncbi:hypothetical protein [Paenarthrobacter ilicis]|uniref:hypothetical protein n=1 Tax=Paenarthrobacter ilicis TaxID=43665 RepID=UPI0028D63380|nr:hypothetical protein [Paenarthrobacter ilicis]
MKPAPLATPEELSDWLGEPITEGADVKRAERFIRFASALVRKESGRTWVQDDGENLVPDIPDDIGLVVVQAAARAYENPNGQTSDALDDWRGTFKVDEVGVYLTDTEKSMVSKFKSARLGGLGTIATTRIDSVPESAGWVPVEDAPDFPWY